MAKKVVALIKLQIPAGQANPAPPVGPALGQHSVNIMEFCKAFNARTAQQAGLIIPVVITVFADRSFTFITKTPPAAVLLKKAAGLEKGSADPFSRPAAFFKSTAAGGVLVMNVNERSAKTVITTGMMSPACCAVRALNALQNSMMFTLC